MKKLLSILISLLCVFNLLIGCGGNAGNDIIDFPDGDDDDTKEQVIRFYGWGDAEEQENYQLLINQFMVANPKITVVYTADTSGTYMTTLTSMVNDLPDIFYMPDTEFLQWADSGRLMNILPGMTATELDTIWPEAVDKYYYNRDNYTLGKSDGAALFGLPKDLGPFTLVYNKDLLDKQAKKYGLTNADLSVLDPKNPMSWADFRTLLKKLIKPADIAASTYGVTHYELETAIYSNNADFYTNNTATQSITDKNFTDALQYIADLTLVDNVMPSAADQIATNGYQRFKAGGSIFSFMGPWDCANFWKDVSFDYDVAPVPYGPATGAKSVSWVGSMSYSISAKSKQPKAALKLAKYLSMNEDCQRKAYELGQQVPNIVSMATDEYVNNTKGLLTGKKAKPANREVFVDTIDGFKDANDKVGGKARARYFTYDSVWYDDFTEILTKNGLWTNKQTAAKICADYAPTFQAALDDMLSQYRG